MADYPISNVARRAVFSGSSGVGPYAFTFEILAQTDLAVYIDSTLKTLTTHYTVTINANGTGSVTFTAGNGPTASQQVTVVGSRAVQRLSDFVTGGDFFATTLNDELDSQTIFVQQVAETAERGLKAPVVDPTDINMTLPSKADRKGTVLAFDETSGNPVAGPDIASVTTVVAQSANINTVATNIASVNTAVDNMAAIIAAPTHATNAAASYDAFDDRYLGSKASAPTLDNDGNALLTGALYWNSTTNQLYIWTGSVWSVAASSGAVASFSAGTTGLTPATASTGAITLAGTLAVANGGTGVTTSTGTGSVVLSNTPTLVTPVLGTPTSGTLTNCTGLPVAGGGTGAATLEANAVLTGNGTGAVGSVAPGVSGNVLTSNGTAWTSAPPTIVSVTTVQTRTQGTYSAPITGDGTEITPLTITFTPKKAGNKVILEWHVNGECTFNTVYIVTRNGVQLADTTDVLNNRWAGVMAQPYDINDSSTPDNAIVRIIDNNTLAAPSIYRLHIRSSDANAYTLYLNRTVTSAGQDQYETSLSTGTAMEITV